MSHAALVPIEHAEELADLNRQITGLRGRVLNLHRVLANSPSALRAFMVMSEQVRDRSSLDPWLRGSAVVTVASCLANDYELHHHEPLAVAAGVLLTAFGLDSAIELLS